MHQIENGYTKIANSLLEAIIKSTMPGNCLKMVIWVMRNSYGYNRKKTKTMTTRQIAEDSGMSRASVHWAMTILIDNGIITMLDDGSYYLNKSKLPCLVQPVGQKILSNPLDKSVQPIGQNVQPIGQANIYKEERKFKERERKGFQPPTILEVKAYCTERGNVVNPSKWLSHYEANGWKVGKNPMKDWKAAVRTWEHSEYNQTPLKSNPRPIVEPSNSYNQAKEDADKLYLERSEAWHNEFYKSGCPGCGYKPTGSLDICNCDTYKLELDKAIESFKTEVK